MKITLFILSIFLGFSAFSQTNTNITIRAKAKDAKFIGTSIGGAMIIVRNADNGTILAQGMAEGSTGNTNKIMRESKDRYTQISDEASAKFVAELKLNKPQFITIEVISPYANRQAQILASTQIWAIPGKHIDGDGIIIEIPGFIIDILDPHTHRFISKEDLPKGELKVRANIVMMCGCTISDGGLWDGSDMEVKAMVYQKDQLVGTYPMEITDTVNIFEGIIPMTQTGPIEIIVYAYDAKTSNTGVDKVNFVID